MLSIAAMSGGASEASPHLLYGAFLLDREAGGYVLIALIAFVLGGTVTLLCLHLQNKPDVSAEGPISAPPDMERR